MRTLKEITTIISNMDDKTFGTLSEASWTMIMEDGAIRRNARKRFLYNLKKVGLTEEEWDRWDNE